MDPHKESHSFFASDEYSTSFDMNKAYIEGQMRHLNIPGVFLAIAEGDKSVHLRILPVVCDPFLARAYAQHNVIASSNLRAPSRIWRGVNGSSRFIWRRHCSIIRS